MPALLSNASCPIKTLGRNCLITFFNLTITFLQHKPHYMVPKVRLFCGLVEVRWLPFFYLLHTRGSEQGGASAAASLIRKGRTRLRQRRAARGECLNLSKLKKCYIKCCEKPTRCTLAAAVSKYNRFLAYVVACVV